MIAREYNKGDVVKFLVKRKRKKDQELQGPEIKYGTIECAESLLKIKIIGHDGAVYEGTVFEIVEKIR